MSKSETTLSRAQVLARRPQAASVKTRKDGSTYNVGASYGAAPKASPTPKTRPAPVKASAKAPVKAPVAKTASTVKATGKAEGAVGTGSAVKRTVNTDTGPITSGSGKVTAKRPTFAVPKPRPNTFKKQVKELADFTDKVTKKK